VSLATACIAHKSLRICERCRLAADGHGVGSGPRWEGRIGYGRQDTVFIDLITGDVVSELVRYVGESAGWIYCDGNGLGPGAER
jgi:hypothetical protein